MVRVFARENEVMFASIFVAALRYRPRATASCCKPLLQPASKPNYGTGWVVNRETREGKTRGCHDRLLMP
jgi:hypothetical protein